MKCIKHNNPKSLPKNVPPIQRVDNFEAEILTEIGNWAYCPKSEWKAQQKQEG